jgi:hypothetical protein
MLRTLYGIIGYQIDAVDGIKGKVHDFLFDELGWTVRYVVAEIGGILAKRRVLISPAMLGQPEWSRQVLPCCLSVDQVEDSATEEAYRPVSRQPSVRERADCNPHLRSLQEVIGYRIHASDGVIGHVYDFVIEDECWSIQFLVVATGNWLPGRKVLVSPDRTKSISWESSEVRLSLSRSVIESSPEYDPTAPVNREYEVRLYDYCGRPKGWDAE